MNKKNVWLLSSLLLVTHSAFADGGSTGVIGGGDEGPLFSDERNPWFLGEEPIQYCITLDPKFPVSKSEVQRIVRESFLEWKQIFIKYEIPLDLPGQFKDGIKRKLTVDAVEIDQCRDQNSSVIFKIGKLDQDVRSYLNTQPRRMIGFAKRYPYNHQTYRTGGTIWVAPNQFVMQEPAIPDANTTGFRFPLWESDKILQNQTLKSLILHEIGHVFGFPHLNLTVMSSVIYRDIWAEHIRLKSDLAYSGHPCSISGKIETNSLCKLDLPSDPAPVLIRDEYFARSLLELLPANQYAQYRQKQILFSQIKFSRASLSEGISHAQINVTIYFQNGESMQWNGDVKDSSIDLQFTSPTYSTDPSYSQHTELLYPFRLHDQPNYPIQRIGKIQFGNLTIPLTLDINEGGMTFHLFDIENGTGWKYLGFFPEE